MSYLKGETIFLRPIQMSDASEEYVSWMNDPEATSGLVSGDQEYTKNDVLTYLKAVLASSARMFAICDFKNEKHIGNVKLDGFDLMSGVAEMGILIGNKDYWGKGVGTEAVSLILDYGFSDLKLQKIWLAVFSGNLGAFKLYAKLGFEEEGRQRRHIFKGGQWHDRILMAKFRE